MAQAPLEFESVDIGTIGFKFRNSEDTIASTCNGTLSVETEVQTVQKKCGSRVVKSVSKPTEMTITISAHLPVEAYRRIQGIEESAELKPGVYAYGGSSLGEQFAMTAEIVDIFEETSKLLAFPMVSTNTGLTFEIEAGADEVAMTEIEIKAYQDELGNWYYEAFPKEAETVDKTQWLTNFTLNVVKKSDPAVVTDITLSKSNVSVAVGANDTVSVTLVPNTATGTVSATSKDTATATATVTAKDVKIAGVKAGATTVDVKVGTITKTINVTVTEP